MNLITEEKETDLKLKYDRGSSQFGLNELLRIIILKWYFLS